MGDAEELKATANLAELSMPRGKEGGPSGTPVSVTKDRRSSNRKEKKDVVKIESSASGEGASGDEDSDDTEGGQITAHPVRRNPPTPSHKPVTRSAVKDRPKYVSRPKRKAFKR